MPVGWAAGGGGAAAPSGAGGGGARQLANGEDLEVLHAQDVLAARVEDHVHGAAFFEGAGLNQIVGLGKGTATKTLPAGQGKVV